MALSPCRFVVAWLALRTIVWTALLFLTQPTLPLDVLEHLAWGREWRLVYAHHPGLPAWINEGLNLATGGSRLALSATAPIASSLGIAAVWLLASRVANPRRAAIAALSLEGAWYFNVAAVEFNHNVLQLTICAWLFLLTHRAFVGGDNGKTGGTIWAALGAVAALSLWAKHSSALFLFVSLAWSAWDSRARTQWKTFGPWVALTVFAVLTAPHMLALIDLNFAPAQFALERARDAEKWTHHIAYPLRFGVAQLGAVLPALLLIFLAMGVKAETGGEVSESHKTSDANRAYVFVVAFAPLILALLISAVGGWRFKSMWGAAMVSFIPLWAVLCFASREVNWRRWRVGAVSVAALAALVAAGINLGAPHWNGRGKRIHYPAEEVAAYVESQWRARHPDSPFRHAAGAKHIASLVSFYAPSRPAAILDGDWNDSFWATPSDFAQHGGAIVWVINDGKTKKPPSAGLRRRLPECDSPPGLFRRLENIGQHPPPQNRRTTGPAKRRGRMKD